MSKLTSLIRRAPKRFSASVLMVAAAIIVPAVVFAWGPTDRPTFTVEKPATYNTFNSITNNPDYGDERNFVRIKDASDMSAGNWKDEITVDSNKEYLVQMYVHNNAADNLNKVAQNVKVMANVPNTTGKQIQIDGFVTSSNATPNKIWDQAIFKSFLSRRSGPINSKPQCKSRIRMNSRSIRIGLFGQIILPQRHHNIRQRFHIFMPQFCF